MNTNIMRQNGDSALDCVFVHRIAVFTDKELEEYALLLREEADRLLSSLNEKAVANDPEHMVREAFQDNLEIRYGAGFSQWMADQLAREG